MCNPIQRPKKSSSMKIWEYYTDKKEVIKYIPSGVVKRKSENWKKVIRRSETEIGRSVSQLARLGLLAVCYSPFYALKYWRWYPRRVLKHSKHRHEYFIDGTLHFITANKLHSSGCEMVLQLPNWECRILTLAASVILFMPHRRNAQNVPLYGKIELW